MLVLIDRKWDIVDGDAVAPNGDDDDDDDDDGCMSATHRCYPGAQDTPLSSRSHTLFNRLEQ